MKKTYKNLFTCFSLIVCFVLLFSLTACGKNYTGNNNENNKPNEDTIDRVDGEEETPKYNIQVGNLCPEFTVAVYGGKEGEEYTVTDTRGKVTVINFWYTTCTPCVAEMPHFARIAEEYGDSISVVAIHSTAVTEDVDGFLSTMGWNEYNIMFAQDHGTFAESETYLMLGGKRTFPMTLILDEEGVIAYRVQGSITYETLKTEIDKLI